MAYGSTIYFHTIQPGMVLYPMINKIFLHTCTTAVMIQLRLFPRTLQPVAMS